MDIQSWALSWLYEKKIYDDDGVNGYFHVGDEVTISDGVKYCKYGVNNDMLRMIGEKHVIASIRDGYKKPDGRTEKSSISLADTGWHWDTGCFEVPYNAERVFISGRIDELF